MLSTREAKRFYDRFGRLQDGQVIYEGRALDQVERAGRFEQARSVVEFGCGTGAFAKRLLEGRLPGGARYLGLDISETMTRIALARLARWSGRAEVRQTAGELVFPVDDGSVDRVVINYVLDLLSEEAIAAVLAEAHRALSVGGLLTVANLTHGATPSSRLMGRIWARVARRWPAATGGCRPIRVADHLSGLPWRIQHHSVVTQFAVSSETLAVVRISN